MKQFSWGAIFRGAIFLRGIFLGGLISGGQFSRGHFSGGHFSGHRKRYASDFCDFLSSLNDKRSALSTKQSFKLDVVLN